MSRGYIQRQKVRSWQLFLLTVGGVMLFWGYLRFQGDAALTDGYLNLNRALYVEAVESFGADISQNDERLESVVGRGLALLHLERVVEAEKDYAFLHEMMAEGRTPAERVVIWAEHNPRLWQRYKGHFLHFDAWIAGERMLLAYRIGESRERISDLASDFEEAKQPFYGYVQEVGAQRREPGEWTNAWAALQTRIKEADTRTYVERARAALNDARYMHVNTPETILKALEPIERNLHEDPTALVARTWHLLMLSELSRRNADLRDGRSPHVALVASLLAAEKLEVERFRRFEFETYDNLDDTQRARFLLAMATASHYAAVQNKDQTPVFAALKHTMLERASEAITPPKLFTDEDAKAFNELYNDIPSHP